MPRARPSGGEIGCLRAGGRSRAAGFGQSHRGALRARLPARPFRSRGIRARPRSEGMCATAWREDSFPHKEAKAGGSGWTEAPARCLLRRVSGLLALHAGGLEELDLVARADDVFVVNPTAVDSHRRLAGDVQDLLEDRVHRPNAPARQIELETVHAIDDARRGC